MFIKILTNSIQEKISGGSLFNSKVNSYLNSLSINTSMELIDNLNAYTFDSHCHYVIDSILLKKDLDTERLKKLHISFLIHLWPSLQPNLSQENKKEFQIIETKIGNLFPIFVTGPTSFQHLKETLKINSNFHYQIQPGVESNWKKKTNFPLLPKKIIYLSNFIEGKGHLKVIDALIKSPQIAVEIDCYGEILSENYFLDFENSVKKLELSSMSYKGVVDHSKINDLLLEYDLLFHFSDYESFGMNIMEAFATNIPCVITPTGNFIAYKQMGIDGVLDSFELEVIVPYIQKILTDNVFYLKHIYSLENFESKNWSETLKLIPQILAKF